MTGDRAAAVALAALPRVGPARLGALLADRTPVDAWSAVLRRDVRGLALRTNDPVSLAAEWAAAAALIDPAALLDQHEAAGIDVVRPGEPGFPARLVNDPERPEVLFSTGKAELSGATVAVIGTRRCSRYGHDVARELGRDLASTGICVVSGLAIGIDAAAHRGAVDAEAVPPVAVVAAGLDVRYPAGEP